jgi:hypothetical protein
MALEVAFREQGNAAKISNGVARPLAKHDHRAYEMLRWGYLGVGIFVLNLCSDPHETETQLNLLGDLTLIV